MFLEVRTEPTEIFIQRKTKRGLWENIANITMNSSMNFELVSNFIYNFWNNDTATSVASDKKSPYDEHVRAVIIGRKSGNVIQVLSSDGLDFYQSLSGYSRCYWSVYNKTDGTKCIYTPFKDSIFYSTDDFHKFIIEHRGIKRARMRNCDESDDYLKTWDITFNDNTEISLSYLEAA